MALVQSFGGGSMETPFDFEQKTLGAFVIFKYFVASRPDYIMANIIE